MYILGVGVLDPYTNSNQFWVLNEEDQNYTNLYQNYTKTYNQYTKNYTSLYQNYTKTYNQYTKNYTKTSNQFWVLVEEDKLLKQIV